MRDSLRMRGASVRQPYWLIWSMWRGSQQGFQTAVGFIRAGKVFKAFLHLNR